MSIHQMNSTPADSLSLNDTRKLMEKSKDRLQLIIAKTIHKRTVGNAPLTTGWSLDTLLSHVLTLQHP